MPVQAIAAATSQSTEDELKQFLLDKIQLEIKSAQNFVDDSSGSDLSDVEDTAEAIREASLLEYKKLVEETQDLRLDKLIQTKEGCSIFDELCVRIDVNQKYVSILPQWKDLADVLEVDKLKTEWIETCVRPREGLTRAMLEVYMKDGGTLGEVLNGLVRLELYEVVAMLKPKLIAFTSNLGYAEPQHAEGGTDLVSEHFFSVLKTLADVLGKGDPCQNIQRYAGGLKNVCRSEASEITTVGLVQSPPEVLLNAAVPKYKSELHFKQLSEDLKKPSGSRSCKILLLFSEDGVRSSELVIEWAKNVTAGDGSVEFFRLNETSLWYEMLTNTEGCCLKWTTEADYIMPILTPKFLQEIHCNHDGNSSEFLPTSPTINRYMYTLMRAQYTASGCKNLKVRPVIPEKCIPEVSRSNAITMDPMFNHVWIPMTQKKLQGRITALLGEYTKKKALQNREL